MAEHELIVTVVRRRPSVLPKRFGERRRDANRPDVEERHARLLVRHTRATRPTSASLRSLRYCAACKLARDEAHRLAKRADRAARCRAGARRIIADGELDVRGNHDAKGGVELVSGKVSRVEPVAQLVLGLELWKAAWHLLAHVTDPPSP